MVATTVYELLRSGAAIDPAKPAITFLEDADTLATKTLTHFQFMERLHQTVHLLHELGIRRDDVVSILSPNVCDAFVAFCAAETAGICNPINTLLRPEEIVAMMRAVRTKILIVYGVDADLFAKAQTVGHQVPSLTHVLTIGSDRPDAIRLETSLAGRPVHSPPDAYLPKAGDVAAFFHTGGTTGSPKLARHLHSNQAFTAQALADSWDFDGSTCAINGLPIFHVAGSILIGLSPLGRGGHVVLPTVHGLRNPRVVANHWNIVDRLKVSVCGGIPTSLVSLLEVSVGTSDISSLKFCLTGGSFMPPSIANLFEERFELTVRQLYGMTETAGLICASHHSKSPSSSSIGPAIRGVMVEAREYHADGSIGSALPVGVPGLLVARGPNVFPGYLEADQAPSPLTEDGWLITGDLGTVDEDGCISVTGRAKDLIIRSGHNIDPAIIEEAALGCRGVGIAAAVGMPDPYAGEVPVVYVTLTDGGGASGDTVLESMAHLVSEPPARPKHAFVVAQMPMTAVGKIDKVALRSDATRRAAMAELAKVYALRDLVFDAVVSKRTDGRFNVTVMLMGHSEIPRDLEEAVSQALLLYGFTHDVIATDQLTTAHAAAERAT